MDKGQLYVFLAAAFFSLQPILLKYAALELPGLFTVSFRFLGTLIIFVPLSFKYRKQLKDGLREWKKFVLPTLFLFGAVLLFTIGVFLTDNATLTSLVTKSNVIFMTLMTAAFFVEERAILKSKRYLAGLVLATIGVIGVITGGEAITITLGLGLLLLIVSQLSWSFFSVSMKGLINKQTRLSILCLIFPLGFLFSIPVGATSIQSINFAFSAGKRRCNGFRQCCTISCNPIKGIACNRGIPIKHAFHDGSTRIPFIRRTPYINPNSFRGNSNRWLLPNNQMQLRCKRSRLNQTNKYH